eukprot:TRINITY_DN2396_c0_g1_i3.p1 TRINITY_DN2396_c0_g1~~TRINITY_DN2396_c0_g1_i3.p1  ORF type:complete len:291 (+),score=65.92 TRINITY_DN2396_c0_g1_i3:768-1640(+)
MDGGGFCFDFGGEAAVVQKDEEKHVVPPPETLVWVIDSYGVDELTREMEEEELSTMTEAGVKIVRLQPSMLSDKECAFGKELKHTDIINGVYEGGFKLWSCAGDLCNYLKESQSDSMSGKTVIEAGCGHGIPGITALSLGAKKVVFQDYNKEVLRLLTTPNVFVNLQAGSSPAVEKIASHCEFWAGDWEAMAATPPSELTADVILSTDTLYTVNAARALTKFMKKFLAYPDGVAYVGSKTMYFGCGGGTTELSSILNADDDERRLVVKPVKKLIDGVDNDREIIAVTWSE